MELRVLNYFLAVAREENITKAAESLHVTQPTLSRQLAMLEEEIGSPLFERGPRRIRLTEKGQLLKRRAEEILFLVDKTENELAEPDEPISGTISLGSGETASVRLLAAAIKSFQKQYPHVQFDLTTGSADRIRDQMEKGLLDFGLLLEPVDMEKYDYIRLPVTERWVVLFPCDDDLSEKETVRRDDLKDRPLILPVRTAIRNELENWFQSSFDNLNIVCTSNLSTNSAVMVNEGIGYSLVIEGSIPSWDTQKIEFRPLEPELSATSVIAWKRGKPVSPAAQKFLNHLRCFLRMEQQKQEVLE